MVQSETFRLLGYFFATIKICLSMLEAVKCSVQIGGVHDFTELIKLILAVVYITINLLLILGIRFLIVKLILINRIFTIVMNILAILYTIGQYLTVMIFRRQMDKGPIALMIILLILVVIMVFEVWIMAGVLQYVKKQQFSSTVDESKAQEDEITKKTKNMQPKSAQ
ncbi:uncharacterized protein LOC134214983 [Armigeres subalbatus]|uniref:uncharacterized protein LOC134214983 n=1 Tax=Armigeres subalbatus TaxID=124917 RepID=UPI002ED082DE